jgi:hypothetical protein
LIRIASGRSSPLRGAFSVQLLTQLVIRIASGRSSPLRGAFSVQLLTQLVTRRLRRLALRAHSFHSCVQTGFAGLVESGPFDNEGTSPLAVFFHPGALRRRFRQICRQTSLSLADVAPPNQGGGGLYANARRGARLAGPHFRVE